MYAHTMKNSGNDSIILKGGCTCDALRYRLILKSKDDAPTTLCHCSYCKKAHGGGFGLTAKAPIDTFKMEKGKPKIFTQDNGVKREFCQNCGSFICEYSRKEADTHRCVMTGTLDDGPDALPPKGEVATKERNKFMSEVPETSQNEQAT